MRVRKLPVFPICAALLVAAVIGVGLICGFFNAFLTGGLGLIALGICTDGANSVRYQRMRRHPLYGLDNDMLRFLCRRYGELEVTFYDSVRAGNCMLGTRDFVRRTFRGRRSIALSELAPYVKAWRVRNVIVYKLQERGVDWQFERADYFHAYAQRNVAAA